MCLHDRHLAEDIKQQVFLEAFRDLDGFEGRSSPRSWLLGITSHRCLDAIKTQQRRSKLIESDEQAVLELEAPAVDPIELLDHPRVMAALEGCLKRLSPDMRATVLMRFLTELTYEEMAVLLKVAADTLQMRVARALRILRQCLEKKGWTGE
jgi:RNA polymerase sigma-70 factor (ECF subfamily)